MGENDRLLFGYFVGVGMLCLTLLGVSPGGNDTGESIRLLSGLLTPVIAIVAAYIAWQQWNTNQDKLRLDLYERRLRIYEEVRKILSVIMQNAKAETADLLRFRTSVSEADFLFGQEIPAYIDEIYMRGLRLWRWSQEYRDYTQEKPESYDHKKVVDGMHDELTWLTEQFTPAKEKFRKYLALRG